MFVVVHVVYQLLTKTYQREGKEVIYSFRSAAIFSTLFTLKFAKEVMMHQNAF